MSCSCNRRTHPKCSIGSTTTITLPADKGSTIHIGTTSPVRHVKTRITTRCAIDASTRARPPTHPPTTSKCCLSGSQTRCSVVTSRARRKNVSLRLSSTVVYRFQLQALPLLQLQCSLITTYLSVSRRSTLRPRVFGLTQAGINFLTADIIFFSYNNVCR